ncbi:MAG: GtrA family protein [Chloroflexi bacterium]|nr:GtrA family protein [Chloroflexota bacterium]
MDKSSLPGRLRALAVRFQKFLVVGAGGLAINVGGLAALKEWGQVNYVLAGFIAIELSLFFTFAFNERWTWRDRRSGSIWARFLKYQVVNGVGMGINLAVLFLATQFTGLHYMLSNLAGAVLSALWNFSVNHLFTWGVRFPFGVQASKGDVVAYGNTPAGAIGRHPRP